MAASTGSHRTPPARRWSSRHGGKLRNTESRQAVFHDALAIAQLSRRMTWLLPAMTQEILGNPRGGSGAEPSKRCAWLYRLKER